MVLDTAAQADSYTARRLSECMVMNTDYCFLQTVSLPQIIFLNDSSPFSTHIGTFSVFSVFDLSKWQQHLVLCIPEKSTIFSPAHRIRDTLYLCSELWLANALASALSAFPSLWQLIIDKYLSDGELPPKIISWWKLLYLATHRITPQCIVLKI